MQYHYELFLLLCFLLTIFCANDTTDNVLSLFYIIFYIMKFIQNFGCIPLCGTCHMASTFMPHPRTATATVRSMNSLLLLGFTLSHSFHFYCCKRLLGRNNTATTSAPHERCQHLLRGALLLSCSVTNLRLF